MDKDLLDSIIREGIYLRYKKYLRGGNEFAENLWQDICLNKDYSIESIAAYGRINQCIKLRAYADAVALFNDCRDIIKYNWSLIDVDTLKQDEESFNNGLGGELINNVEECLEEIKKFMKLYFDAANEGIKEEIEQSKKDTELGE